MAVMVTKSGIMLILGLIVLSICVSSFRWSSTKPRPFASSRLSMAVAPFKAPRAQNCQGNLFVDESCIDCDVCRWVCPSVYKRVGIKSAVYQQPGTVDEKLRAFAALLSCPVGAIRTRSPDPLMKEALYLFPTAINVEKLPGVLHLGYHSLKSIGATPYLLALPEGNVMIDTPRFNSKLADNLEEIGGVHSLIVTHKDTLGDHAKWKERFPNLQRVIHSVDINRDCKTFEAQLEGDGEWHPFPNVTILHTPGHTAGSISVFFQSAAEAALFSGDHLAYDAQNERLDGFKAFCQGNIDKQAESIRLIATDKYPFLWLMPAHGRMIRFASVAEKNKAIKQAAKDFEDEDESLNMIRVMR